MRRSLRVVADLALTLGALVGVACLVAAIGSVAFGVHPLIFRSGSMAPTIPAGSLAFARDVPAADIRVGDVVSVPWRDSRVTHRVVEVFHRDGSATLKLRGDANDAADQDLYQVSSAPRVWFSVPVAGRVVAWLSRAPGVFVLAAYAALLLSIVFRRMGRGGGGARRSESRTGRKASPSTGRHASDPPEPVAGRRRLRRRRAVGVGAAVLMLGAFTASPTWAAWSDTAAASGSTLGTYTVPKPGATGCSVSGNALTGYTATITWPSQTTPYPFTYTATIRETGANATVTTNGSNRQTQVGSGLLGSLLGSTVNVDIRTQLPGTAWTSAPRTRALQVGLLGASLTCGTDS